MVNGTTYAKKIEVEHKKRKQKYRYRKKYIALLQTIDIESNMTILIYNNTVICQYGNIDINKDIGCRTLSEWSYRTMWQRQKVSLILSVKHGQRSASEKKNEPYFLMAAWKVCSIRSMGCCWQRPWRMFDLSPLLLWSEEKLCSWAVSPCLRNTQQRRAWRELAKGNNTNIDMLIFLYIHIDINKAMQIYDNVEMIQYSNTSIHQYGNVAI